MARIFVTIIYCFFACKIVIGSWEEWWTYEGISGPDFWGLLNPEWKMCTKGRRQSPVNIDPSTLLYDPFLRPLHVDKLRVNGFISNTGHSVRFRVESTANSPMVNISHGPLSYNFRFQEIHLRYGKTDNVGSEHTVDGHAFPAELQIFGYNTDLYSSMVEAESKSQGLVGIALLLQLGELTNIELRLLTSQLQQISFKGQEAYLKSFSLRQLIPDIDSYITYDGSTTMPGCHETVTWLVINKPLYISRQQLYALRKLMQGEVTHTKAPLANNFRPIQSSKHRLIRTNIDFQRSSVSQCPTMYKDTHYEANKNGRSNLVVMGAEFASEENIEGFDSLHIKLEGQGIKNKTFIPQFEVSLSSLNSRAFVRISFAYTNAGYDRDCLQQHLSTASETPGRVNSSSSPRQLPHPALVWASLRISRFSRS